MEHEEAKQDLRRHLADTRATDVALALLLGVVCSCIAFFFLYMPVGDVSPADEFGNPVTSGVVTALVFLVGVPSIYRRLRGRRARKWWSG